LNNIYIEELINKAANKAATEAIKEFKAKDREDKRKNILHNTRLLLKKYKELIDNVQNSIDEINQLDLGDLDLGDLSREELYIESIKKSKIKTLIMIAHIDKAMEILKENQIRKSTEEKYEVLEKFYLMGIKYDDIVEQYQCGVNTPRRWMNEMIDELSILLFGIDGLKLNV
jgi:transcription initiation factor TFIID subunit TAF12